MACVQMKVHVHAPSPPLPPTHRHIHMHACVPTCTHAPSPASPPAHKWHQAAAASPYRIRLTMKLMRPTFPGLLGSYAAVALCGAMYQWRVYSWLVQWLKYTLVVRQKAKSSRNMVRTTRSMMRSSLLRLEGGLLEFMKILVSWPGGGGSSRL